LVEGVMMQGATTNFVLAGGSEAGLLLTGLAIADELRALVPQARFLFSGSGAADECRRVCHAGYEYLAFGSPPNSRRAWRWPWSGRGEERRVLKRLQPAAVISLGGAIGETIGNAAAGLGLPLAVLEQRAAASPATQRLAAKASLVCLGFEETRHRLAAKCPVRVTGIPVARPATAEAGWLGAAAHVADLIRDLVSCEARRRVA